MATLAEILRAETMDRGQRTLSDLGLDDLGQQRRAAVQMLAAQMAQRGDIEGARLLAEAADMDQSMIPTIDPNQVLGGALAPQMAQVRDAIARFIEQDKPFLGLGFDPDMTDMADVQRQVDMLVAEASRLGVDPEVARALVLNQVYPLLRQGAETGFFNRGDMTARLAQALGMSNVRDEQGYMPTMGEIGTIAALASLIPLGLGGAAGLGGSLAGRGVSALSALFKGGWGGLAANLGIGIGGPAAVNAVMSGTDDAVRVAGGLVDDASLTAMRAASDPTRAAGTALPLRQALTNDAARGFAPTGGVDDLAGAAAAGADDAAAVTGLGERLPGSVTSATLRPSMFDDAGPPLARPSVFDPEFAVDDVPAAFAGYSGRGMPRRIRPQDASGLPLTDDALVAPSRPTREVSDDLTAEMLRRLNATPTGLNPPNRGVSSALGARRAPGASMFDEPGPPLASPGAFDPGFAVADDAAALGSDITMFRSPPPGTNLVTRRPGPAGSVITQREAMTPQAFDEMRFSPMQAPVTAADEAIERVARPMFFPRIRQTGFINRFGEGPAMPQTVDDFFGAADDIVALGATDDLARAEIARQRLNRARQATFALDSRNPSPRIQAEARRLADGDRELYDLLIETMMRGGP